jgi:hypothetical protein
VYISLPTCSKDHDSTVDFIERSLTRDTDCADVLMLLANRGGINSLMAEVLEDDIPPRRPGDRYTGAGSPASGRTKSRDT